jgi:dTDP-4-amino-4,6-dideoxygalactose transaminase
MYYLLVPTAEARATMLAALKQLGIGAIFHYVPLHSSPAGRRYGRAHGQLPVTTGVSERLIRLPLWLGIEAALDEVITGVRRSICKSAGGQP